MTSVPQDDATVKRCTKCGETKPLTEFHFKYKATGRRFSWCKSCHHQMGKIWKQALRDADPARFLEVRRLKRDAEAAKIHIARWRAAHPQPRKPRKPKPSPEERKEQARIRNAALYQRKKEYIRDRTKRYRKANQLLYKAAGHRRRARKQSAGDQWTPEQWEALKTQHNHCCLKCGKQEPEIKLTVDHVLPLIQGGSNDITNIQPLCGSCNSSKGQRHIDYRP